MPLWHHAAIATFKVPRMVSSTSVRFPEPLKAEATAYAERLGISLNALCAVALRDYLDARNKQPEPEAEQARPGVSATVPASIPAEVPKVGANQPCPCGSGQKYKRCHGKG